MKSQFVDKFNHDEDALEYDHDVKNEENPIRAGYQRLLNWVAYQMNPLKPERVLELGVGTGNLAQKLRNYQELICVDTSSNMIEIARSKLHAQTQFQQLDLLQFFEQKQNPFNAIVSTYAIHHLTKPEKHILFSLIYHALDRKGVAIFGDLMFKNTTHKNHLYKHYSQELIKDIEDEFFWDLELSLPVLKELGFKVDCQQFSELSWGILAKKDAP